MPLQSRINQYIGVNAHLQEGMAEIYAFHVEESIPIVAIPLAQEQRIAVNFGSVYDATFSSLSAYSFRVDYEQHPDALDRYSPADQAK